MKKMKNKKKTKNKKKMKNKKKNKNKKLRRKSWEEKPRRRTRRRTIFFLFPCCAHQDDCDSHGNDDALVHPIFINRKTSQPKKQHTTTKTVLPSKANMIPRKVIIPRR